MKKIQTTLLTVLLLIPFVGIRADKTITIVDTPNRESTNANYTNFRAPLQQAPLLKLPVGKVQPKGWLRKYLELQRDGLNGQLGTVSAWLDKNNNQWLSNQGDHGWEEVPYWIRGYCSLAYILDDEAVIVGTSAVTGTELDSIVNQYSGIYNNPFLAWSRYRKGWLKTTLPISFQFHHAQMDGKHATRFLEELQRIIKTI